MDQPDEARCTVYLNFHHPNRRADEVTAALRIEPERCWDKGAARNTSDGRVLSGREKEMYWTSLVYSGDFEAELTPIITAIVDKLEDQKEFIRSFPAEGGKAELAIYWDKGRIFDCGLPHKLIQRLADCGIGLDLYPR